MGNTRRRWLTAAALGLFVAASAYAVARRGLFISSDTVFLWVLAALLVVSLTDLRRFGRGLVLDWLPLGLLLVFYDSSRGISERLGIHAHDALQIRFDEALFGRPLLTVRLQHWLHQGHRVHPYEYVMFGVYMTHFFMALLVAAVLWQVDHRRFRRYRAQLVTLNALGFATYVLYPADPPWIVSQRLHRLPEIHRIVFRVWDHVGLHTAQALVERGSAFYNQVAAVPSMHAATTLFLALFFWGSAPRWVRALLVAYVVAMAWTLVDGGEHYVFDLVLGWAYALAVVGAARVLRRAEPRRVRRHGRASARARVSVVR